MRTKRIQERCKKVIAEFAESIEDNRVKNLVLKNTIITGGAIASMLQDEDVKDYDIYFRDKETTIAVAEYFMKGVSYEVFYREHKLIESILGLDCEKIISSFRLGLDNDNESVQDLYEEVNKLEDTGISVRHLSILATKFYEDAEGRVVLYNTDADTQVKKIEHDEESKKKKYRILHISPNAITLSEKIQLVIRFYGEPEEIHENYDFIHTTNYWTSWDNKVVTNTKALESILTKTLIYTGSKYPLCSVLRTRKFIKRGYFIDAGQYLKMIFQLNELDLSDYFVLEEQLIGVDTLYFEKLLSIIKNNVKDDYTAEYLNEIISRIFD